MAGESGSTPTPGKTPPQAAAPTDGARKARKTLLVTHRGEGGHRRAGMYFGTDATEVVDPTPEVEKQLIADKQLLVIDPTKRKKAAPKTERTGNDVPGKDDDDKDDDTKE